MADPLDLRVSENDLRILASIAMAEAPDSHGPEGRRAVMAVVMNRMASPDFPSNVFGVVGQKNQFEPVGRHGGVERLPKASAKRIEEARKFMTEFHDPTNGALYFLNPAITDKRGTTFKSVSQTSATMKVGNPGNQHWFYRNINEKRPNRRADSFTVSLDGGAVKSQPTSLGPPPSGLTYNPYGKLGETSFTKVQPQTTIPVTTLADQPDDGIVGYGFSEGVQDAIMANTLPAQIYANSGAPDLDPNFELNEDHLKGAQEAGVRPEFLDGLTEAHSEDHVKFITGRIVEEQDRDDRLASLGGTGTALQLGAAIFDPINIIPVLGLGSKAVRGSKVGAAAISGLTKATTSSTRLGAFAKNGALAGAYGGAYEALLASQRPTLDFDNVLMAAGGGFVLGGAAGAVFGKRAGEIRKIGENLITDVEARRLSGGSSAGAAEVVAGKAAVTEGAEDIFKAADANGVSAVMMDDKYLRNVRTFGGIMDTVAQLKNSSSPLVRNIGNIMGEDVMGNAKGETAFGATERAGHMYRRSSTNFYRDFDPAFKAWVEAQGISKWRPDQKWQARNEFSKQVTEYVRLQGKDEFFEADANVAKAGEAWRRTAAEFLKTGQNPGAAEGKVFNAVRGFASKEVDNNYVPRYADGFKVNAMISHFGEAKIAKYIKEAIEEATPDIDPKIAEKMGNGYISRLGSLGLGEDTQLRTMFDFTDPEDFKVLMREERDLHGIDISDDEIDMVSEAWRVAINKADPETGKKPNPTSGNVDRGRRRTLMNEDRKVDSMIKPDGTHFTIRDLFDDNMEAIMNRYTREMSGHVAMAQVRVANPLNPEEMLVDGVTKPGDWVRIKEKIKSDHKVALNEGRHADTDAMKVAAKRDLDQLDWLRRQVLGLPEEADKTNTAEFLRLMRGYQFLRVMGQVGFAQIPEMMNIVAQTGMEASFKSMPSLKSLWRNAQTGQLDDGLSNELEAIWGFGAERLRASSFSRFNEWASNANSLAAKPGFRQADNAIRKGQQLLSDASFMAPVNTYLHRWTMRAMVHKFSNLADGAELGASAAKRLEAMGLSDDMLKRTLKQMKAHRSVDETGQIKRLNLEKWKDAEARATFEMAMDRFARRIIQENDPGQMSMWMSDPIVKMFTQFRTFMLGSWGKQFLYNARMRDWQTFVQFSGAMMVGAATHITQTHLRSFGVAEGRRKEYLKERLELSAVARAAFQRGGWTPMLSTVVDTAALAVTNDPVFDYRTTGQAADIIFGNPTMDFLSKLEGKRKNFVNDTAKGRSVSQQSIKEYTRLGAFSNTIPFLWMQQMLLNDLPEERSRSR